MRTPKEVAESISPAILKCIEGLHFDKRIYEWMAIYAKEYHQSEVLKLNKANVSRRLPSDGEIKKHFSTCEGIFTNEDCIKGAKWMRAKAKAIFG